MGRHGFLVSQGNEAQEQSRGPGQAAQQEDQAEVIEPRAVGRSHIREQKPTHGRAHQGPQNGHRGKPGEPFTFFGPGDVRHHRHGHRAVNGSG